MSRSCRKLSPPACPNGTSTKRGPTPAVPACCFSLSKPKPTEVYDTYWRFAAERQAVFFRRARRQLEPWTTDQILLRHKFTNAYRASDRVSQFLIKHVIYNGDQSAQEVFFRTLLFKVFNKIETWQLLLGRLGQISHQGYDFRAYDQILDEAMSKGRSVFSAAYMMPSGSGEFADPRKHRSYLRLIEKMLLDKVPERLFEATSMGQTFELLRSYPMIGAFLAYQYVTDLNYSGLTDFSEMDFVVPGPGALSGIRKCFETLGDYSEPDVIRMVADQQEEEFASRQLHFESLWGRRLQLIDCQNLFCETDKYARVAHPNHAGIGERKRIKQVFRPTAATLSYWFPPKWGINEAIE